MKESSGVIYLACAISTTPLQIIGFVTPFWTCFDSVENRVSPSILNATSNSINSTCDSRGVFYFCNEDGCQIQVLENVTFWLCLVSVCTTCLTTLSLVYIFYKKLLDVAEIQWALVKNKETFLFAGFLIAQLLAGQAVIIVLIGFGSLGWSALIFTTMAIPEVVIAAFTVTYRVCLAYCAKVS